MSIRITHAQPVVEGEGEEAGRMFARPLLSEAEAEVEAGMLTLGGGDLICEFGEMDGLAFDFYTHRIRVISGPEHLCREYLLRLAG